MSRRGTVALMILALAGLCLASGCGFAVGGPRFWWDDQEGERLADDYHLPPAPEPGDVVEAPMDVIQPMDTPEGVEPVRAPRDERAMPARTDSNAPLQAPGGFPAGYSGAAAVPD